MLVSFLILATVTAVVAVWAWRRDPAHLTAAGQFSVDQGIRLAIRLPFALVAASCLAELIPDRAIAAVLGADTGLTGVLVASLLGGLLPGGPMVTFPVAVLLAREGAGGPQLIALVTGWSVYAIHRVISYEGPIMGWRFVALRMLASLLVPPAAAIAAGLIAAAAGLSIDIR
jgi:uncharacterized membrane protein YraQ (UPF0718 family)